MRSGVLSAALALLCFLVASAGLGAQQKRLVILHTNDTHSHIDPLRGGKIAGRAGVIERAAYIDSVRTADGAENVLLLDAGDISQGTSYFTVLNGDIEVKLLDDMGYDAFCLGNHEFDNGIEELARRLRMMRCPALCANYNFSGTPLKKQVAPYTIIRRGGFTIGIIGLLTDVSHVVEAQIASKLTYMDPVVVVRRYASLLKKKKGCDIVICLSHLGYRQDLHLAGCVRDVDIIVGGHSHTEMDAPVMEKDLDGHDVMIVQDGSWGYTIGKIELTK